VEQREADDGGRRQRRRLKKESSPTRTHKGKNEVLPSDTIKSTCVPIPDCK